MRASWITRLLALFSRANPNPQPEPMPPPYPRETPLSRLYAEQAKRGKKVFDCRGYPRNKDYDWREWGWPPNKKRGRAYGLRDWSKVTAVMLHRPGNPDADWHHKRWLGVPVQLAVADDDTGVLLHPLNALCHAGHLGNDDFCVHVEFGYGASPAAMRAMVRYAVSEIRANGGGVNWSGPVESGPLKGRFGYHPGRVALLSHGMVTNKRDNRKDCGAFVWQNVARPLIQQDPGIVMGPVIGSGKPIPEHWR